jgi:hypothetical protein
MNTYGGVDVQIHVFFTWVAAEDVSSPSRPGHFTLMKIISGTHWIGSE